MLSFNVWPFRIEGDAPWIDSLRPLGMGTARGLPLRPALLDEASLLLEMGAQRLANPALVGPKATWGKWAPCYQHVPPPRWHPACMRYEELVLPRRRLCVKTRVH